MKKPNGHPTWAEFEKLRLRHDSYATANTNQVSIIKAARIHIEKVEGENAQLAAELLAVRESLRLLSLDSNTRYDGANREVIRLHKLLEEHGIDPGG